MGKIRMGYGSEWHLLRFMARHRKKLEEAINACLGEGEIDWLDFKFGSKSDYYDCELKGLSFLEKESLDGYIKGWENKQSWDAVFKHNGIIYLVEAKAHLDEMKDQREDKGGMSKELIKDFICNNLRNQSVSISNDNCMGDFYQLANRLGTAAFLTNNGFETKCIYIYFLNGYDNPRKKDETKTVKTVEEFKKAIKNEMNVLGLKQDEVKSLLYHVFVDAENGEFYK